MHSRDMYAKKRIQTNPFTGVFVGVCSNMAFGYDVFPGLYVPLTSLLVDFSAANVVNGRSPTRLPKPDIHALIKVGLSGNIGS